MSLSRLTTFRSRRVPCHTPKLQSITCQTRTCHIECLSNPDVRVVESRARHGHAKRRREHVAAARTVGRAVFFAVCRHHRPMLSYGSLNASSIRRTIGLFLPFLPPPSMFEYPRLPDSRNAAPLVSLSRSREVRVQSN